MLGQRLQTVDKHWTSQGQRLVFARYRDERKVAVECELWIALLVLPGRINIYYEVDQECSPPQGQKNAHND